MSTCTLPDFSGVPIAFRRTTLPQGTELDELEADYFGGSLSAWAYLNEPSFKHLHITYRLTDGASSQEDLEFETDFCEDQDKVEPCVAVFALGGQENEVSEALPEHVVEHLCYQISRLQKVIHCDLSFAYYCRAFGEAYQDEDDAERNPYAALPGWMLDTLDGAGEWWDVCEYYERTERLHYGDEPCLRITRNIEAVLTAETIMNADEGPACLSHWAPELGLFHLGTGRAQLIDDSLIEAAWQGQGEMCQNFTRDAVHLCNNEIQLRKALRYLLAVDNLIETLCQIATEARSKELKPSPLLRKS